MAVSTVKLNDVTLMTVNDTTAVAADVASGEYFYAADGTKTAGSYVAPTARTASDVTVSGATVTIPSGAYASQVQKSVASGTAGTPTATKGTVSNHAVSITPSVTNTTGYITGGTKTGTAVSVSASELVSGTKTITENGTGVDVTNYASVDVNVSGGGSATIQPLSVTQNGTYTAPSGVDGYSPVTVNVQGGGGSAEGGVRFYDYEGTLLHSYSVSEFNALTAMPSNPSHTGLVAQGWNWSLADAKAHLVKYPEAILNIGQNYTTDTGDTRVYIYIDPDTPANRMTFYFRFTSSVANNATVDWGDGTIETLGSTTATDYPHTYSTTGNFTIKLTVNSGTVSFIGTGTSATSGYSIFGNRASNNSYNRGRVRAVEIGDNITQIGQSYFLNCYSLETVSLPSTITNIGSYAFSNCYSITSIAIPDGVTSISNYAFQSCYDLTSIAIPDGVTSIGTNAFSGCHPLTSITIPDSVTSIGTNAFNACYALTSIDIPDGVTEIESYMFSTCYALASIAIPDGVTSIGANTFQNCSSLTSITIPDGVTSISSNTFQYCYALTSIAIPDGVTSIGTYAFQSCYALTSIDIPDGVTSIGNYAFHNCYALTSIDIPDGVPSIGNYAFTNCYSLTSIIIPDGVTSIGSYAFSNNHSMSEYHFLPTTPPTLANTNAFGSIPTDCKMYVPQGCLEAYQTATNWSTYASYMVEESA